MNIPVRVPRRARNAVVFIGKNVHLYDSPPSMIEIRLPDGKALAVPRGVTSLEIAERIGSGLARAALASRVNGDLVDLRAPITADATIEIVTSRDPVGGEVIRHSAEHVMADAVKRLYPDVQIDVGRTDHSEKFQYDFLVDTPFTPADLEQIEKEMSKILAEKSEFTREATAPCAARAALTLPAHPETRTGGPRCAVRGLARAGLSLPPPRQSPRAPDR